jgi:hypothetical protein
MPDRREITPEHREKLRANMKKANLVRLQKANMRVELRRGDVDPIELLLGNDERYERLIVTQELFRTLIDIPQIGRMTAGEILEDMRISPVRKVGTLSYRRRKTLARNVALVLNRPLPPL